MAVKGGASVFWTRLDRVRYSIAAVLALAFLSGWLPENVIGETVRFMLLMFFMAPVIGWPRNSRDFMLGTVLIIGATYIVRRLVPAASPIRTWIPVVVLAVTGVWFVIRSRRSRQHSLPQ
jgi:hypothetical protein